MAIRITCINKSGGHHQDPHHAIQDLGWVNEQTGQQGKSTRLELYNWLKSDRGTAYVKDQWGNVAYVGTQVNVNGTQYVQTYADKTWTDNLLSLPECVGYVRS
jgi:hypothetical protein